MPLILPEEKEQRKAVVKQILTFNPSISIVALSERLKETYPMDRVYIGELVKEIRQEAIQRITQETKEDVVAYFAEMVEYVNNQLRAIAQEEKLVYSATKDGVPKEKPEVRIFAQSNRIKALVEVIKNVERLTNMKMDLGLLERKLGEVDVRALDVLAAVKYARNNPTNFREATAVVADNSNS